METQTSLVSIIIVGLNHWPFLEKTISSLFAQKYPSIEVIYVDNASTDESITNVRRRFPQVKIIANPANYGFCKGNNQGIQSARGEFILILNPDVIVADDCIEEFIKAYAANKRAGIYAPKLFLFNDKKRINSVGMRFDSHGRTNHIGDGEVDLGQYSKAVTVPMASGACMFSRRAVLDEIGFFDEHYFAYYEDGELSLRAWWMGWECVYWPNAIAYHVRNAAAKTSLSYCKIARYYENRNRYFLAFTFMPFQLLIKASPFIFLKESLAVVKALGALPKRREIPIEIKSRLAAIRLLPKLIKKRRRMNCQRLISNKLRKALFKSK